MLCVPEAEAGGRAELGCCPARWHELDSGANRLATASAKHGRKWRLPSAPRPRGLAPMAFRRCSSPLLRFTIMLRNGSVAVLLLSFFSVAFRPTPHACEVLRGGAAPPYDSHEEREMCHLAARRARPAPIAPPSRLGLALPLLAVAWGRSPQRVVCTPRGPRSRSVAPPDPGDVGNTLG